MVAALVYHVFFLNFNFTSAYRSVEIQLRVSLWWSKSGKVIPQSLWLCSHQIERKMIVSHHLEEENDWTGKSGQVILYSFVHQDKRINHPLQSFQISIGGNYAWQVWPSVLFANQSIHSLRERPCSLLTAADQNEQLSDWLDDMICSLEKGIKRRDQSYFEEIWHALRDPLKGRK